ncbi:MAG: hypothetical protein HKP37_07655 [Boseongicola sp.]|nr:hypothetical protein [Boseongicola sp.]
MIGAIGDQPAAFSRPSAVDAGRRGEAVGQQAKAAVAAARSAGAELPKNAQGLAASGIARGADPASIFAALVTEVAPGDAGGSMGGVPTTDVQAPVVPDDAGGADTPVDAAPSAPVAPPPPNVAGVEDGESASIADTGEVVQVAVSQNVLSVDDGEIALELLTREASEA